MTSKYQTETIPDRDMTPAEYLDIAKKVMQIESDYELAKRLEVTSGEIHKIRHGYRSMPLIIATKIAITINIDPMSVIADVEAQSEKKPKKAEFWRSFLLRAGMGAVTACTPVSGSSGSSLKGAGGAGGSTAAKR